MWFHKNSNLWNYGICWHIHSSLPICSNRLIFCEWTFFILFFLNTTLELHEFIFCDVITSFLYSHFKHKVLWLAMTSFICRSFLALKTAIHPPSWLLGMFRRERCLCRQGKFSADDVKLSGIWSGALIGWRGSYIVLAIVYEWQTKEKSPQRSNINVINLYTKQSVTVLFEFCSSLQNNTKPHQSQPGET